MPLNYGGIIQQLHGEWLSEKPSEFHTQTRRELLTPAEVTLTRDAFGRAFVRGLKYAHAHPETNEE